MAKNFELPYIPERPEKPREAGVTMMMDKGLSLREVENFIEANGDYTDIAKLGFGTAYVVKDLEQKIKLYKETFDHIDLRIPQQIFWQEL